MSARSNPFEELERLFERMTRQFDEASRRWESGESFGWWPSEAEQLAIDLVEHDDEFVVTVDLPGFERDDVIASVTDRTLRIEAEREKAIDEEEERFLRHERRHKSMHRTIQLPGDIDTEAVEARMRNGVLTITLPRLEAEQAQKIEIE